MMIPDSILAMHPYTKRVMEWSLYGRENDEGPWLVCQNKNFDHWWIINVDTRKLKRIGKVSLTGKNYFDLARETAAIRNQIIKEKRNGSHSKS